MKDLDEKLASLPVHDASPALARRTRARAHEHLAILRTHAERPWLAQSLVSVAVLWSRIVMPVALASVVGVYLTWAFVFASSLYR